MAFTKAHLYNDVDLRASLLARAISHPARIGILQQLSKEGVRTVEELIERHPLSQSTISQHLKILRKASLVCYKEVYPYTYYTLNKENARKLKKAMKICLTTF